MPGKRYDSKGRLLKVGECEMRPNLYQYRFTDKFTGKRQAVYSNNLKDLRKKETEIAEQIRKGLRVTNGKLTVGELMTHHLETKSNLARSTLANYKSTINCVSRHPFSKKCIQDVRISDCQKYCIYLHKEKSLTFSTIKGYQRFLMAAFDTAVNDDILAKNPWRFRLSSIIDFSKTAKMGLNKDQQKKLIQLLNEDAVCRRHRDWVLFLMNTGLRISELSGLVPQDFDFFSHMVTVQRQLLNIGGQYYVGAPKSNAGKRVIWMNTEAEECIKRIIKNRNPDNVSVVAIDGFTEFLFITKNGTPKFSNHFEMSCKSICKRYQKKYGEELAMTPHTLRHTFATNAIANGMSGKGLQYCMGHAHLETSFDIYVDNDAEFAANDMKRHMKKSLDQRRKV